MNISGEAVTFPALFHFAAQLSLLSDTVRTHDLSKRRRSILRVTSQGAKSTASDTMAAIAQQMSYSCDEEPVFIVDRDGEKYEVVNRRSADDIFSGMDVEMGMGSFTMARMTYGITQERLNVVPNAR